MPGHVEILAGLGVVTLAFIAGGYQMIAAPVLAVQYTLMSITIWQILSAISPVLAPIISAILLLVGRIIWSHEKRLRNLEKGTTRQSRTLYGDEDDAQQTGLSEDLHTLSEKVDDLDTTLNEIKNKIDDSE